MSDDFIDFNLSFVIGLCQTLLRMKRKKKTKRKEKRKMKKKRKRRKKRKKGNERKR
jgi:hypothetical protein